jgi:hypothetical protein
MSLKLVFAAEVYDDIQENIHWYNKRQPGLGSHFFKAVKEQVLQIKNNPFGFAVRYDDVRCAKLKGFPYLIHYKIFQEIDTIKITAVFSTYRNPKIWKTR